MEFVYVQCIIKLIRVREAKVLNSAGKCRVDT